MKQYAYVVGGEAHGFDPWTFAPITTIATNVPPPWDMERSDKVILRVADIWGISEGTWPIAHASPKPLFFFHYLNEPWARILRRSFDAGRDWHADQGGFAQ
jgi:hypothetical protein